jgi:hypothetical protein
MGALSTKAAWAICADGTMALRGVGIVLPSGGKHWRVLAAGRVIGCFDTRREAIRALENFARTSRSRS